MRGVFRLVFVALAIAGVAVSFSACGSSSVALGAQGAASCGSVGGKCVLGNVRCKTSASSEADDCNPNRNPGGGHCCIEVEENPGTCVVPDAAVTLDGGDAQPITGCQVLGSAPSDGCLAQEYMLACHGGHPEPASEPEPSLGCHLAAPIPGNVEYYCCPCHR
jgi:hypothetical protein